VSKTHEQLLAYWHHCHLIIWYSSDQTTTPASV